MDLTSAPPMPEGRQLDTATRLPSISVVIPVYNSAPTLRELIARLEPVLSRVAERFEVILVNDDSRDDSWNVIRELVVAHDWISGFDLMRNFGQHNALLCGIRAGRHELMVTLDDDLQNPPEEIPSLLAKLEEGFDVVYGSTKTTQNGFLRGLASKVTRIALQSAMGADIARNVSAFRAFRTDLRRGFADYRGAFVSIDVLLTWATKRFSAVPVRHEVRRFGTSNYTFRKLAVHALNMVTGFSTLPLQLASLLGFCFALFGAGVLGYVVTRYLLYGGGVPGFAFLASLIAILSGAQLFTIGIIGEYLARIHFRVMDRPTYVARVHLESQHGTDAEPDSKRQ